MSEQKTWQVGDVVRLKSGGPALTVVEIDDDIVYCSWFASGDGGAKAVEFPALALESATMTDGRVQQMATDKQLEMLAKYGLPGAVATLLTRKQAAEALNYFTRQRSYPDPNRSYIPEPTGMVSVPVVTSANAAALQAAFGAIPDEPVRVAAGEQTGVTEADVKAPSIFDEDGKFRDNVVQRIGRSFRAIQACVVNNRFYNAGDWLSHLDIASEREKIRAAKVASGE